MYVFKSQCMQHTYHHGCARARVCVCVCCMRWWSLPQMDWAWCLTENVVAHCKTRCASQCRAATTVCTWSANVHSLCNGNFTFARLQTTGGSHFGRATLIKSNLQRLKLPLVFAELFRPRSEFARANIMRTVVWLESNSKPRLLFTKNGRLYI